MHFVTAPPDTVRAINQRWLLKFWNECRNGHTLPTWRDLQGREFAAISHGLCFVDVVRRDGTMRFLMRYHSAWLGELYGFDCHNQFLDEMPSGQFQDAVLATYRHVVAARAPVYASVDITDGGGRLVHYERLLLPFGRDGTTVDRILASLEMVSPDGAFQHRDLISSRSQSASFSTYATIRSVNVGPDVVQSVNQRWLLNLWQRLRNGRTLPAWQHLPVDDLKRQLETLMFCDVVPDADGGRFLIRQIGQRIALSYGGDFQGRHLDEALPPVWRSNALITYRKAIEIGRPVYNAVDTRDRDDRLVHLERLLLPFSSDGTSADRLLASIETISLDGKFEQENLGQAPRASNTCAFVATIEMD
jgi:hypothetical protein